MITTKVAETRVDNTCSRKGIAKIAVRLGWFGYTLVQADACRTRTVSIEAVEGAQPNEIKDSKTLRAIEARQRYSGIDCADRRSGGAADPSVVVVKTANGSN